MNGLQGNGCILKTDIAWGLQKLGLILENKVPLNLKLVKGVIDIRCLYNSYIKYFQTAWINF